MNNFYLDNMIFGMKPFSITHKFGVNGKIAGNLAAIQEIENTVAVLYGPKGCAFHYKYSTRARNKPFYELESVDFKNKDVIFGAEYKLKELLLSIDENRKPDLIFIIPTVVSDIINDDLETIGKEIQSHIKAKVVVLKSQAFSHMDKTNSRKMLKEKANLNSGRKYSCSAEYKGCGYVEVMNALVEQVMQRKTIETNTVNIESFIWGYDGTNKLLRIKEYLHKMGIKVNCFLPAANIVQIQEAPSAQLNIVRRKQWAMKMQKKFGSDYLHISDMQEWHGIEGIIDFYMEIGKLLKCENTVKKFIENEKNKIIDRYNEIKASFVKYKFALISESISDLGEKIRTYYDYGINLEKIFIILNPSFQEEYGLDKETLEKIYNKIELVKNTLNCNAQIIINPQENKIKEYLNPVDYIICSSNPLYSNFDKPCIPSFYSRPVFDFFSFMEIMEEIYRIVINKNETKKKLLLNRVDFNKYFYPLLENDVNSLASREMYCRMWRLR